MARSVEINLDGAENLRRYLEAMPRETETVLRRSVNRALKTAHTETLIQITRTYTISMNAVEKDLKEFVAKGGSIVARLSSRGRPRGALNFNITPAERSPKPAWTSKTGYTAEILRGQRKPVSKKYFWIRLRAGNVHLARRDGKKLRVFHSVSTPQMLGNETVSKKVTEVTKAELEKVFAQGMERRLLKGL